MLGEDKDFLRILLLQHCQFVMLLEPIYEYTYESYVAVALTRTLLAKVGSHFFLKRCSGDV